MMRSIAIATLMHSASAYYWMDMSPQYSLFSQRVAYDYEPASSSSHWSVSPSSYELKVRLPDVEPQTIRAALGADGNKVEITAERKIDGCSCQPSVVKEVALPYRPRAEDIDVALDKNSVLSLKLQRHAKTDSATPLAVTVAPTKEEAEPETRPLRFVPHESATQPAKQSADEQEKTLTEKFRSAALASVAVQQPSAKEAAAATAEGAVAADADAPPAATAEPKAVA